MASTSQPHNIIIRKKKQSNLCDVTLPPNQIIRKKKIVVKPKTLPVTAPLDNTSTCTTLLKPDVQIEKLDIISECSPTIKKSTSLSKEEMIEDIEYQRDVLVKNQNKYTTTDYQYKLSSIDKLLSQLKGTLIEDGVKEMTNKRITIDKIVLAKKIPIKQFIDKIDLTGENDHNDPTMGIFLNSRSYFKDKVSYQQVPSDLIKLDPSKNKRNFGNKPMPPDLLKFINFR